MYIELRSDTFTQPTPGMLDAMMSAKTGDDVFGEDPSINQLEEEIAQLFGMEAALFCPSGTMTNQIGIKVHTQPGDEVICDELSHVYQFEGGGIGFNSGCATKLLQGNKGRLQAQQIVAHINPDDVHKPISSLVVLENTCNRGGGTCYQLEAIKDIQTICTNHHLSLHLDGARIWNALVAKNHQATDYGHLFDSISVCMSKGMGAPVGSLLIGKQHFIKKARRIRKILGGGMRQAGYLAAAAQYALHHHLPLLAKDHMHASAVAQALNLKDFVDHVITPETNILIFEVKNNRAKELVEVLDGYGIKCMAFNASSIRMVFHLGVSSSMVDKCIETIEKLSF